MTKNEALSQVLTSSNDNVEICLDKEKVDRYFQDANAFWENLIENDPELRCLLSEFSIFENNKSPYTQIQSLRRIRERFQEDNMYCIWLMIFMRFLQQMDEDIQSRSIATGFKSNEEYLEDAFLFEAISTINGTGQKLKGLLGYNTESEPNDLQDERVSILLDIQNFVDEYRKEKAIESADQQKILQIRTDVETRFFRINLAPLIQVCFQPLRKLIDKIESVLSIGNGKEKPHTLEEGLEKHRAYYDKLIQEGCESKIREIRREAIKICELALKRLIELEEYIDEYTYGEELEFFAQNYEDQINLKDLTPEEYVLHVISKILRHKVNIENFDKSMKKDYVTLLLEDDHIDPTFLDQDVYEYVAENYSYMTFIQLILAKHLDISEKEAIQILSESELYEAINKFLKQSIDIDGSVEIDSFFAESTETDESFQEPPSDEEIKRGYESVTNLPVVTEEEIKEATEEKRKRTKRFTHRRKMIKPHRKLLPPTKNRVPKGANRITLNMNEIANLGGMEDPDV